MKVVCAWCETVIRAGSGSTELISHGMCAKCQREYFAEDAIGLGAMMNQASYPILVYGPDGKLLHANSAATAGLAYALRHDENPAELLFACDRARSGNCGKSSSCEACQLRCALRATREDGQPRYGQVAQIPMNGSLERLRYSTIRGGGMVIVLLDDRPEVLANA